MIFSNVQLSISCLIIVIEMVIIINIIIINNIIIIIIVVVVVIFLSNILDFLDPYRGQLGTHRFL